MNFLCDKCAVFSYQGFILICGGKLGFSYLAVTCSRFQAVVAAVRAHEFITWVNDLEAAKHAFYLWYFGDRLNGIGVYSVALQVTLNQDSLSIVEVSEAYLQLGENADAIEKHCSLVKSWIERIVQLVALYCWYLSLSDWVVWSVGGGVYDDRVSALICYSFLLVFSGLVKVWQYADLHAMRHR